MMDKINTCIACGGENWKKRYKVKDNNENSQWTGDLIQCECCGLGMLSPFPNEDTIDSFYRDTFYDSDGNRFRGGLEKIRLILGRIRGYHLNKTIAHTPRALLDFGSGAGHFAATQRKLGWDVVALDPYNQDESLTNDNVGTDVVENALSAFEDESFDAITLWNVIEHLSDPLSSLRSLNRLLKPGGILLLSQQNFASIQAKIFGSAWLILDPPRHLWQFTPTALSALVDQVGAYTPIHTSSASLEMGPFTILQSTLNILVGNGNYLFKFMKSKYIRNVKKGEYIRLFLSFIAAIPLAPISLVLYFILRLFKSGDIFTTLYQKKKVTK